MAGRNESRLKRYSIQKTGNGYKLRLNFRRLGRKLDRAQLALDIRVNEDILRYVPIDTGTLRSEINALNTTHAGTGKVYIYPPSSAYGHYQHEGIVYKDPVYNFAGLFTPEYGWFSRKGVEKVPSTQLLKYQDPNAKRQWGRYAIEHHGNEWYDTVKRVMKQG